MTTLEIILSVITVICSSGNIIQFASLRAIRREANANASKASAEAQQSYDSVLYQRIDYLDKRIEKLEKLACYQSDCHRRFNLVTIPLKDIISSENEKLS